MGTGIHPTPQWGGSEGEASRKLTWQKKFLLVQLPAPDVYRIRQAPVLMQRTRKIWAGNEGWQKKPQVSLANVIVVLHLDLRKMEISFLLSTSNGFLGPQEKQQIKVFFLYGQAQNANFRCDFLGVEEFIYHSKYLFIGAAHVLANKSTFVWRRTTATEITRTFHVGKPSPLGHELVWAISARAPGVWLHQKADCVMSVSSLPCQKKKWRHSPTAYNELTEGYRRTPKVINLVFLIERFYTQLEARMAHSKTFLLNGSVVRPLYFIHFSSLTFKILPFLFLFTVLFLLPFLLLCLKKTESSSSL